MDRIVFYPEPVLRKVLPECSLTSHAIQAIASRLIKVLERETHGIGIAAPQINIEERVAIVDISSRDTFAKRLILVNPVILAYKNPEIGREGCMSVPDYTALIKRFHWIRFSYSDELGYNHEKISSGLEAVCIQHEIDHLNGKLLIDCVCCLKTDLLPRKVSRVRSS